MYYYLKTFDDKDRETLESKVNSWLLVNDILLEVFHFFYISNRNKWYCYISCNWLTKGCYFKWHNRLLEKNRKFPEPRNNKKYSSRSGFNFDSVRYYRNFVKIVPIATRKAKPIALFVNKFALAEMDVGKLPNNSITTITPKIPVARTLIVVATAINPPKFFDKTNLWKEELTRVAKRLLSKATDYETEPISYRKVV